MSNYSSQIVHMESHDSLNLHQTGQIGEEQLSSIYTEGESFTHKHCSQEISETDSGNLAPRVLNQSVSAVEIAQQDTPEENIGIFQQDSNSLPPTPAGIQVQEE